MKKYILSFFLTILFLLPFLVSAAIWLEPPLKYETIEELIEAITGFILVLALVTAPTMVLIGAYNIMTSGGDPIKVKKGREFILYSALGLGIILFARGIVAFIKYALGAE